MKRLPWYKLFPENWFRYTSGLSREAKGDYMDATAAALMDGENGKTELADTMLAAACEASHKQSIRARARWDAAVCRGMPEDAAVCRGMPEDANQRREIEKRKIGFQPQQAISNQPNPNQPNARANAGETEPTSPPPVEAAAVEAAGADTPPTAPHGPQDARREPQAADPSPRPSPPPSPRTEAQGAAPVGGIAGTVRTVLQSVVAGGGENKPAGSAMKQFLSTPKEAVWQLPESLLPEAAARYTGSKDAGKSTATFTRQMARVGAMPFRRELARWIGECEAGENGGLRNPTGAFFERVNKAAEVPA